MSRTNLRRDEAEQRARTVQVHDTAVSLDLTTGGERFASRTVIRFAASAGAATFADLLDAQDVRARLNGTDLPATAYDGARLRLAGLAADNVLEVAASLPYGHTGEGLHRFVDPVDGEAYLYTHFEPADAQRAFACFDQPDLKGTWTLDVTVPAHWTVLSVSPGRGEPAGPATARWTFPPTPRLSSYCVAVVAGPYVGVHDTVRCAAGEVPLGLWTRASLAADLDPAEIFEITRQGFGWFEEVFGTPYPFVKYDQVFVPEFNMGAMENAGCVTFREDYVFRSKVTDAARETRANTILHELAHMWFGDLVTMRWWDDLWLNESFAEFMAHEAAARATRFTQSWTVFATGRKAWGYRQDQLPTTHPIAADAPDIDTALANVDGITYAKGASVLKQLVAYVGWGAFTAGLANYLREHAYANTRLADLLAALEATSGRDLAAWGRQWLATTGVATLRPVVAAAADGVITSLVVEQSAPDEHPTLRAHRVAVGLYDAGPAGLVRRARVEVDVAGPRTEVTALAGHRRPDLLLVNDDDLTFAKMRLDAVSLATLRGRIAQVRDPLARALCWAAAWDMTRDAELPTRDFVALVAGGLAAETQIGSVQQVLAQARTAAEVYAEPGSAAGLLATLAKRVLELARAAEPGSDRQLAFARGYAGMAAVDDAPVLSGWLDGSVPLAGLTVDADLRWALLQRLVALGAAEPARIEAELARDATAKGRLQAITARAMEPCEPAKAAAWSLAVDDPAASNYEIAAAIAGFQTRLHLPLLEPYLPRYFEVAERVFADRTGDVADAILTGLYPLAVRPDAVEPADRFLARDGLAPVLRRAVLEGRAGVERALRAQACDATAGASAGG